VADFESIFLNAFALGITKWNFDFWYDFLFLLIFLILSIIIIVSVIRGFIKIFSSFPAFEINQEEIILYHNSIYDRLPFNEMIESNVYSSQYSLIIVISFKPNSKYGNYLNDFRRKIRNISKENSKIVFLSVEFADVKANELNDKINKMIEFNKIEK
jgi:hypothetical protein